MKETKKRNKKAKLTSFYYFHNKKINSVQCNKKIIEK